MKTTTPKIQLLTVAVLCLMPFVAVAQQAPSSARSFQNPSFVLKKQDIKLRSSEVKGLSAATKQASIQGGADSGGGDLCEDRIQMIRSDLRSWIEKRGFEALILPKLVTKTQYNDGMLDAIASASIKCVGIGDRDYPIEIQGIPKVCKFEKMGSSPKITCDFNKFQSMSETAQYVLIHHEFAGIANIEKPNGADSNYDVSNQITNQLADQVVKRLVVKQPLTDLKTPPGMELIRDYDVMKDIKTVFLDETSRPKKGICYKYLNGKPDLSLPETIDWHLVKNIVERSAEVSRAPDDSYFNFIQENTGRYKIFALFKISENKTNILSVKITKTLEENDLQRINVGTLAKPEFRYVQEPAGIEYTKICHPN